MQEAVGRFGVYARRRSRKGMGLLLGSITRFDGVEVSVLSGRGRSG